MAHPLAPQRPRTPGRAATNPPGGPAEPPPEPPASAPRRSSFNFLRRGKSVERLNSKRSLSGKLSKRPTAAELSSNSQQALPRQPPVIPQFAPAPKLQTFGGENARPPPPAAQQPQHAYVPYPGADRAPRPSNDENARPYGVPVPEVPGAVDPYARTGRYSYASSAVSSYSGPRRVRRRKDPTPFNILVLGARNSGKTSFIEFLRTSLALPARKTRPHAAAYPHEPSTPYDRPASDFPTRHRVASAAFVSHYLETETGDGERVGLTLWDSEGLDRGVVDLQLREVVAFLESKFEDTFGEETKVVRAPGTRDTHIHCVFLVLDPLRLDQTIKAATAQRGAEAPALGARLANGRSYGVDSMGSHGVANGGGGGGGGGASPAVGGLDELFDLQVLRALQGKTTVIPIISKADTVTAAHMGALKRAVDYSLKLAEMDPFAALGQDDDDDDDDDDKGDEDASSDDEGRTSADVAKRAAHRRHNSRAFDERDEDGLRPGTAKAAPAGTADGAMSAHLDTSSSTTTSSSGGAAPAAPAAAADTTPDLPLSILAPEEPSTRHTPGRGVVGRYFAWGAADPYDPAHCDFVRLRALVFEEWRAELREASREVWYEGWRTSRLHRGAAVGGGGGGAKMVGAPGAGREGPSRGARMGARMAPGGGVAPGVGPGRGAGMGPGSTGGRMASGGGRPYGGPQEPEGVTALPGMAR